LNHFKAIANILAASRLFDEEPKDGKVSESFDSVISFLKGTIPNEAEAVQEKLKLSDEAIKIMERIRTVEQVALRDSNASAMAEEWRDVANQYQAALGRRKLFVHFHTKLNQGVC
jgi:hypothetical protein